MSHSATAPRKAAVRLLDAVLGEGRLLSELLPGALERLDPAERARAARLALSCLRQMDRADRMLGPFLKHRPPLHVHNVLRLAVVEMFAEGAPAHGVVNAAVEIVRAGRGTARLAGLTNAVLRRLAAAGPQAWEKLPPPRLPRWLRKPLIADYGRPVVEAMERAHARGAPLDLTVKESPGDWAARLGGAVVPTGSVRLPGSPQVSALPGYRQGAWWVQDAAAALPARILAPAPGEAVLDMCAAPGGKTMQLAASGAHVTALDISASRMKRVAENLSRTGLRAGTVVADALDWRGGPFDAVLLDAPCSATGTIRRHPDLPHARDGSEFPALFSLQARLIDRALELLRPGGRLMFCTCSLLPDEGEEQVKDALARHRGLTLDLEALDVPGVEPGWIGGQGLRTRPDYWPDRGGMDGFFMTLLRKPA